MKQRMRLLVVLTLPTIFFIIAILNIGHYGINWDEPYHYRRGQAFLQYFLTGQKTYFNIPKYPALKGDSDNPDFRDAQNLFKAVQENTSGATQNFRRSFYQDDSWNGEYFIDIENSYGHPALNDVLAALSNKIFYQKLGILGDLESYRLFIIFVVTLTTFAIGIFMWKEYGIIESIFSSLFFSTYPLLLAEQHFNIKDPVETSFYTLTIITAYLGIKKNKLWWLLISSLLFSFALATKFNIVFCIFPLCLWFLYSFHRNRQKINKINLSKKIAVACIFTPLIAFGILLISFPTLWKGPINGLGQIIQFYLNVGYPNMPTLGYKLFGFINTYPLVWIFYTTPPIVLFLLGASFVFFRKLVKKNNYVFLLFAWLIITIARNSLFGALSYGGVRLIMEYIPAFSMVAGITAGLLIRKNKGYSIIFLSIILLGSISTIYELSKIHPNENIYFNFLIGGLSGAKEKNIPYWGDSYGNAYLPGIQWLNQNAEINAKVSIPVGNTSNIPRFKLRQDIAVSPYYWSGLKHGGEYLIELTYNYPQEDWFALKYLNEAMIPVYENKVDGIAIAKVWKNDLDHVKEEYKSTQEIPAMIMSDQKHLTLSLEIPKQEKILKVQINEPTKDCEALKTGYVEVSSDGITFVREPEDTARDQLNRQEPKQLNPVYEFYFAGKLAKVIRFSVSSANNCLIKAKSALITTLTN